MATVVRYTNGLVKGQLRSARARVGRVMLHFVEMFVAMMVGMAPYMALAGKPTAANLIPWYAGMELSMVPGMVALMMYQRHGWRHTIEMTVAMLAGPVIFISCAILGVHNYFPGLSVNTLLRLSDPAMILGMLAAMLYRRDMYTSPHANHHPAGHTACTDHTH